MARVFVGHDWAEDHHDVFIEDDRGEDSLVVDCLRASIASAGSMRWLRAVSTTPPMW
jgi:hypothetical protein